MIKDCNVDNEEHEHNYLYYHAKNLMNFKGKSFLLNKSSKNEVVSFMQDLSSNITGLRESSKNLISSISRFQKAVQYGMLGDEKVWLEYELEKFIDTYNSTYNFLQKYKHSPKLLDYAQNIKVFMLAYKGVLIGKKKLQIINLDRQGQLKFDNERFRHTNTKGLLKEVLGLQYAVINVKEETIDFLTEPLSEYMGFKDLACYYNYKLGDNKENTFKIIENGLLLDLII